MGCLTAAIYTAFLYDIDSSVENENTEVETTVSNLSNIPEVAVLINAPIDVQTYNFNLSPSTSTYFVSQTLHVEVSLVCTVETGDEELLRVIEENLITIDGQYIKVLRNVVPTE